MQIFFKTMGFWGRTIGLIIITLVMLIVSVIFGDVFAYCFFGRDAMVASDVSVLQFLHGFVSVFTFVLPPVVLSYIFMDGPVSSSLGLSGRPRVAQVLICVAIMLCATPMVSWMEEVNLTLKLPESMSGIEDWMRQKEEAARTITEKFINSPSPWRLAVNLLVLALVPALGEELYFRVAVQKNILESTTRVGKWWAAVIAAVIFSAIHLQFFGFWPRMVLGAMLGFMLVITGNVWCSVISHFVNNSLAVILAFVAARGRVMDVPPSQNTAWMAAISAAACVALFVLLYRMEKK